MNQPTITVLESVDAPAETIKYIDQVVSQAPDDISFRYFSWATALLGRYDVFHVHWPEFLIRGRRRWVVASRRILFRLLLVRLRLLRIRVVRTIHNLEPHTKGDRTETRLLKDLDALTSAWVRINVVTEFPEGGEHYTVMHGSYREQFAGIDAPASVAGRLLYIGRIEPYKGVPELVRAFSGTRAPTTQLRVVGKAEPGLRKEIAAIARTDPRITCVFEFVSDTQLISEVSRAELVILPYREMHNSGIALIALSLNRPILVPDSAANTALADEVGHQWVLRYVGDISPEVIESAVSATRSRRGGAPSLEGRDWYQVGRGYAAAFRGDTQVMQ